MECVDFVDLFSGFAPLAAETVAVGEARGRILAEALISPEALPPCARSTMDGFAVRAVNTLGCSASETALLRVIGEITMGSPGQRLTIETGQAARIWTGGELPHKADAVVMVEYTQAFDQETVAIFRPVAPGEHVIQAGKDYAAGATILAAGSRLRPQDLGVLAALGIASVLVYRRPRVAILSSGDELVPADQTPPPGKIRDINSITLAALVEEAGGLPVPLGLCSDDFERMRSLCIEAIRQVDVLLLSGGSSMGQRDFTHRVFAAIPGSELLAHGVSVRPGRATILARLGNKALFGLPGHPASAQLVFLCCVRPLIRQYSGLGASLGLTHLKAITAEQIPSVIGREEYVRVRLDPQKNGDPPLATPVYGASGLLSPLIRADGLLPIGRDVEGLKKGAEVLVLLFP